MNATVPSGKIVLTGGPCAGKSTLAEVLTRAYQYSVVNVPEAASLLFAGGFPRFPSADSRKATQRAIYYTQLSLEGTYTAQFPDRVLVLDRATVDGAAYWPEGADDFFRSLDTSLESELARYERVIYLESADQASYMAHKAMNPYRTEDWEEAKRLDEETLRLWSNHPSFVYIRNNNSFAYKVSEVLAAVSGSLSFAKHS